MAEVLIVRYPQPQCMHAMIRSITSCPAVWACWTLGSHRSKGTLPRRALFHAIRNTAEVPPHARIHLLS